MAIVIESYTEDLTPAVKAFNCRLAAGGVAREFRFPETSVPEWLPRRNGERIYQEYFVAVNGDRVHGGFILKSQDFVVDGRLLSLAHYRLPVSEGIIDRAYASVGVHMLRGALKMRPMLFALGMGGLDRPLPQMLGAAGWSLREVPFFFRVNHPSRFFRQVAALRQSPARRLMADLAAISGIGWLGIKTAHLVRTRSTRSPTSVEAVEHFGPWADQLWQQCHGQYGVIARRDRSTLNPLYSSDERFIRLKITRGREPVGWVVVLDTQMQKNKYFGDLRVGTIVDGLAQPQDAPAVVQAATEALSDRGVDVIVSNQAHRAWGDALKTAGFFEARSNFIFAASPQLSELIGPLEAVPDRMFLNRGDGDGPVNL
jgi:hypothetical protein